MEACMEEKFEIISLVQEREQLENQLNKLIYGSIEVREEGINKYVYVQLRHEHVYLDLFYL